MTDGRVNGTIPVAAFSFGDFYERAFFKAWEAEHACHELFLLIVASGNTKDVLSVLTPQFCSNICSLIARKPFV